MVSAVILAAGLSRRMGQPKLLLPLGTRTVIEHVVDRVSRANIREVIVVLGAWHQEIANLLTPRNVKLCYNPRYAEGQASSVAAGSAAVSEDSEGIMFVPGDLPLIVPEYLNRLIEEFYRSQALIVKSMAGTPAIFSTKLRQALTELSGDTGGRQLLDKYKDELVIVPADQEALDIDTPEDYREVLQLFRGQTN